jgi:hypothetical protein
MTVHPIRGLDAADPVGAGTRLGRYEVLSRLGAGGMGTVYRGLDTRLGREVAIKMLDGDGARETPRRRRFEREARLASAVNHPQVLTVLDVDEWNGRPYVVSELLEGQTLRAHLRPGVLTVQQAVGYAVQVCRGLAAIHARGIVHRDHKPENIFVTTDGRVKILDLGLAGPVQEEDTAPEPWDAVTSEGAGVGGTAAYMSPEQVRRLPTDNRSDIFACGVLLYEMLARRRPFDEETQAETMTAVLRREPKPLGQIDSTLPRPLVGVVERCLEKRPEDRFHSAHDLGLALEAALNRPGEAPVARPAPSGRGRAPAWAVVAACVVAFLTGWRAAGPVFVHADKPGPALVRYDAAAERFTPFLEGVAAEGVDFSRDGQWVTYTSYPEGELWCGRIGSSERRRLTDAPLQAALPRWSPDGSRIAFTGRAPGQPWRIHLVSRDGGSVEVLGPEEASDPGWTPDGRAILFGRLSGTSDAIGQIELDSRRQTIVPGSHGLFSPRPSPDGRYLAALGSSAYELRVLDLGSGSWSTMTRVPASYPAWSRDGAWLHFRSADGSFRRVDPATGREETVATARHLALAGGEWGAWSGLSPDGAPLVLRKGGEQS